MGAVSPAAAATLVNFALKGRSETGGRGAAVTFRDAMPRVGACAFAAGTARAERARISRLVIGRSWLGGSGLRGRCRPWACPTIFVSFGGPLELVVSNYALPFLYDYELVGGYISKFF